MKCEFVLDSPEIVNNISEFVTKHFGINDIDMVVPPILKDKVLFGRNVLSNITLLLIAREGKDRIEIQERYVDGEVKILIWYDGEEPLSDRKDDLIKKIYSLFKDYI